MSEYILPSTEVFEEIVVKEIAHNCCLGSFCAVSKARLASDNSLVAIKRANVSIADPPPFVYGYPLYTPRVIYRYNNGKETIIVEEWVDGKPLFDFSQDFRKGQNSECLLEICTQLVNILQDLIYRQCIYHADLTPNNVLVKNHKTCFELKLIDFDPWYPVGNDGNVKLRSSFVSGSIPFMPPECLRGELVFDAEKASVYCVGAISCYLRYGYAPYCQELNKAYAMQLMFGSKHPSKPVTEKVQREDFRWFCSQMVKTKALGSVGTRPVDALLPMMLDIDPCRRPTLYKVHEFLQQIRNTGNGKLSAK